MHDRDPIDVMRPAKNERGKARANGRQIYTANKGHCVAPGINTSESPASFVTLLTRLLGSPRSVVLEMARIRRRDGIGMRSNGIGKGRRSRTRAVAGALNVMTSSFRSIIVQPLPVSQFYSSYSAASADVHFNLM